MGGMKSALAFAAFVSAMTFGRAVGGSFVDRYDRVVAREQQHPMRARRVELGQQAQRSTCFRKGSSDCYGQRPVAPKHFSAGLEGVQPQLDRRAGRRHGRLQSGPGRADDGIGREDVRTPKIRHGRVAAGRQGLAGQHFPGKQGEGVMGWVRQQTVKPLQLSKLRR